MLQYTYLARGTHTNIYIYTTADKLTSCLIKPNVVEIKGRHPQNITVITNISFRQLVKKID